VVEGVGRTVRGAIYYLGRFGQLIGMGMLLVDVVTAGPLGPNFRLFATGVSVFLVGWGLTHAVRRGN
jgi:hypothetical protein